MLGCAEIGAHKLHIVQCAAYIFGGYSKAEFVPRLKQYIFRLHKSLPYGAICSLPKISAFGMLNMRASGDKGYFHIGYR